MAQFKCEVVVFIAVICAARASVTVNIYEDGKYRLFCILSVLEIKRYKKYGV